VGGRLPGLRLAAADARTAGYLSDKILQLEAGEPLPGTLAETDLRFHLYHDGSRIELLMRDYQGEHVALGRDEPIGAFLRDCDALWLCLDAATVTAPADRLRRQQEIEQLLEAYLAAADQRTLDRPVDLVLTKGDLLGDETVDTDALADHHFGMTRYTLASHCPNSGLSVVSSLGGTGPSLPLEPRNLAEPLTWLARGLRVQDEARLERIWSLAGGDVALLGRCVACFARRYPDAPATGAFRQRLREAKGRQRLRRVAGAAVAAACLLAAVWTYDLVGYRNAARFEEDHAADARLVRGGWLSYQTWHPTRHFLRPGSERAEEERLARLDGEVRSHECAERLVELRRRAADPDADAEDVAREFREFGRRFPEAEVTDDLRRLGETVEARRQRQAERRDERAHDELVVAEEGTKDLLTQVALTERFLRGHPGAAQQPRVRARRDAYLARIAERDFEAARDYSARHPLNFQTRLERYQALLDKHPQGDLAVRARAALRRIEGEWDRKDFRAVRDHYLAKPAAVEELVTRCRAYLAVHPDGRFKQAARDLLAWSERVTERRGYTVAVLDGEFDKSVAHTFSWGPKLSVMLEVNGVRYGPSPIVRNRYDPTWNYEFPRAVEWKLGDRVKVLVSEHTWRTGVVAEKSCDDDDVLGMRMLTGEVQLGKHKVRFKSDFRMPVLPRIE
jgi:hypothetical protein